MININSFSLKNTKCKKVLLSVKFTFFSFYVLASPMPALVFRKITAYHYR